MMYSMTIACEMQICSYARVFFFSKFSTRFFTREDKVPQAHFSEEGAVPRAIITDVTWSMLNRAAS
jgi:hypothetical protein